MTDTIYQRLRNAGAELDNHASDLYVKATPTACSVVRMFRMAQVARQELPLIVEPFVSDIDGSAWLSIPFAFDPFWEQRAAENPAKVTP